MMMIMKELQLMGKLCVCCYENQCFMLLSKLLILQSTVTFNVD